jgi:Putative DNA-binding domain
LPLNIDVTAAIRRPADQEALVRAVLAAGPTDETYWLEWKREVDLDAAEGRFTVAQGILGLANRHPDHAARAMEGCGYLLAGVEPNNLVGLTPIDGADLEGRLRKYLSQQGPQWSPAWIPVDGTHVLLVTVEPPRWGDSIHVLHKEYKNYYPGTVFVRRGSSTAPANPAEIADMEERRARRADYVRVELTLPTPCRIQPIDLRMDELDAWLGAQRQTLLDPLEQQLARQRAVAAGGGRPVSLARLRRAREKEGATAPTLTLGSSKSWQHGATRERS